jgi:hypothetical protein
MIADVQARSLAFRIGRPLVRSPHVAGNGLEQLATGREFCRPLSSKTTGERLAHRTFTTYARRVGYLESVLKAMSGVDSELLKLT